MHEMTAHVEKKTGLKQEKLMSSTSSSNANGSDKKKTSEIVEEEEADQKISKAINWNESNDTLMKIDDIT